MHETELWIDVVCRGDGRNEVLCTLFASHALPTVPRTDERLSYLQEKGSNLEFKLISPIGPARSTSVSVTVEEVSHYAVRGKSGIAYKTAVRTSEIPVASEQDARAVCHFMTSQLGFSIDPYGVNKLSEPSAGEA